MIAELPRLEIRLGGFALTPVLRAALTSLHVRQRTNRPALCVLVFRPTRGRFEDVPEPGTELQIETAAGALFSGHVTALEYGAKERGAIELVVRAYDALDELAHTFATRRFTDITLPDLARALARDCRTPFTVSAAAEGARLGAVVQCGRSHLDLLTHHAARAGLAFNLTGDVLHLHAADGYGAPLALDAFRDCDNIEVEHNPGRHTRHVQVDGWDASRGECFAGTSAEGGAGGARAHHNLHALDRGQASTLARAIGGRERARSKVLNATLPGNPEFRPGRSVQLTGLHPGGDGRFVLYTVEHRMDARTGFTTALDSRPPEEPDAAQGRADLCVGHVLGVDDPEGRGRVRVALESVGGLELGWLPVCLPGAGSGHGLACLPDVGDRVALLFDDLHAERGLVLGGLTGPGAKGDSGVEGAATRRRELRSPDGHRFLLDQSDDRVVVEHPSGSRLEFTRSGVHLTAKGGLVLEAPGDRVCLRGSRIDLERG